MPGAGMRSICYVFNSWLRMYYGGYRHFLLFFSNDAGQGPSFQRKGAKTQRTQRKYLFCLALRPLHLRAFALEADSDG